MVADGMMLQGPGRKRKMSDCMKLKDCFKKGPPNRNESPDNKITISLEKDCQVNWCEMIDVSELAEVIRSQCDEKILLLDCRSFFDFMNCNIVNSIHMGSNNLFKRRLQKDKLNICEFLCQLLNIQVDSDYQVVIYRATDVDPTTLPADDFISVLGRKCSQGFRKLRLLRGGFLEFQAQHPSLLESKALAGNQGTLSQPCLPVMNVGPTKILPYLFLGSMKDALNPDVANANGITYVLNVSMTCPKPPHIQDAHFLRIPVNDNYIEKLLPYFHEAFQFIDKVREANACVLVHCLAGISRSPTLAIAYIMRSYNMVSEEAYRYVKAKRATISPNFNFLGQLLEYEQQIDNESTSQFSGSKRKCLDDLRSELSAPSSPVPRQNKCLALDVMAHQKAHSPTTALSRLRFDQALSASAAQSPTLSFSRLKFGAVIDNASGCRPTPIIQEEPPEFMTCYTNNTIHHHLAEDPSLVAPRRSISLDISACNRNYKNNLCSHEESPYGGSPTSSPSLLRPHRPMSLSLGSGEVKASRRPDSLTFSSSDDSSSSSVTSDITAERTVASPSYKSFTGLGGLESADLREHRKSRARPNSMALVESSACELGLSPTAHSKSFLTSSHTAPSNLNSFIASAYGLEAKPRSRSLEDIISPGKRCSKCLRIDLNDVCVCRTLGDPVSHSIGQSNTTISSTGSHNSLHGSLEMIQVS